LRCGQYKTKQKRQGQKNNPVIIRNETPRARLGNRKSKEFISLMLLFAANAKARPIIQETA
jgi:hypothetical protein